MSDTNAADDREAGSGHANSDHDAVEPAYRLEAQVGFLLRQAGQRHHAIFAKAMPDGLTPRQWAVLVKLHESGASPQNLLGRKTAMDVATIKGVVERLRARGLVEVAADRTDGRRRAITLTAKGLAIVEDAFAKAHGVTRETLGPLAASERAQLLQLLAKIS